MQGLHVLQMNFCMYGDADPRHTHILITCCFKLSSLKKTQASL